MNQIRPLFDKYQPLLLWFANTYVGRQFHLHEEKSERSYFKSFPIVKITPDATHYLLGKDKNKLHLAYVGYPKSFYLKKYALALQKIELCQNWLYSFEEAKQLLAWQFGFNRGSFIPAVVKRIMFASGDPIYPNAHEEISSVDGRSMNFVPTGVNWATMRGGAGTESPDDETNSVHIYFYSHATSNLWQNLVRGIFLFDTSGIGLGATNVSGIFSIFGISKSDPQGWAPDFNVYSSAPASNIALAAGDYDSLGSTPFCNIPISYADFNTSGYNDLTLNSEGIAALVLDGITKFGTRNANYDIANNPPTWAASKQFSEYIYFADNGSNKPKLVVYFNIPILETPLLPIFPEPKVIAY